MPFQRAGQREDIANIIIDQQDLAPGERAIGLMEVFGGDTSKTSG